MNHSWRLGRSGGSCWAQQALAFGENEDREEA